jgi:cellulose synthase (UDP-forming)
MDDLAEAAGPWSLVLVSAGAFWLGLAAFVPSNATLRALAAAGSAALGLRYGVWRVTASLPAALEQGVAARAWALIFVAFEMLGLLSALINLLFLARTRSRSAEADAGRDSRLLAAPVDVFIATYNEARDILERTILGARAIEHADLRVWVLDDGARDWVRDLAASHGAHYVRRVKGRHAKAGNVNNALQVALATGRRPAFILLLDADFVAGRDILRRTLPLFAPEDVGIVQTPQHFFNPDPIQLNLLSPSVWPDEQRFFFNVLMPSLDAWGCAFCCGTSAVLRVDALEEIGGMATETVTEDMLTSFKLVEHGWRTVFLDEPLSLGLAPEGIAEYIGQRGRWCLGGIQQLHTRWSFLGRARLRAIDRLNNLSTALYWSVTFAFRLMLLAAPAIWWWTGAAVLGAPPAALIAYMAPWVVASTLFTAVYSRNHLMPVLSDVTQLVAAPVVVRMVACGLLRPWGRPFKVTAKGVTNHHAVIHWRLMAPFLLLLGATVSGLAVAALSGGVAHNEAGFAVNLAWSLLNCAMLAMTCAACIDIPKRRVQERFTSGERAVLRAPGHADAPCRVLDISVGGASLHRAGGWAGAEPPEHGRLWLDDGRLTVPFRRLRAEGETMSVRFEPDERARQGLILKLFDTRYAHGLERVSALATARMALARLFA